MPSPESIFLKKWPKKNATVTCLSEGLFTGKKRNPFIKKVRVIWLHFFLGMIIEARNRCNSISCILFCCKILSKYIYIYIYIHRDRAHERIMKHVINTV